MRHFSIKDLAEFSGLKQHTIRIWEQRYSFLQPQRSQSSHRTYTAEELNVLLDVVLLNQNGYKISRIDKMTLEEKLQIFSKVVDQQQKAVHELIIHMAKMDAEGFEMALDSCMLTWGIHVTIQQILLPFCNMVGLLQTNGTKNYVENIIVVQQIIKQKLYTGIEKATATVDKKEKVLLFLPPGELQEITMLYLQYVLKTNGYTTVYLGHQLTVSYLNMISQHTKPQYIITHITKRSSTNHKSLSDFVLKMPGQLPQTKFISIEKPLTPACNAHQQYMYAATLPDVFEIMLQKEVV
ncbi:MAG TPA: MerR family transcriptional regulator [Chitinophagaceae bacterium]|jgi:DNA-binding transcriptional MerR regulator|nr:MerR family transcriptional regulator [Chitinophagaceae bacterium]